MIYWSPLFHFYQPPTQIYSVLKKVCTESYLPLIEVFKGHPHAKATVNIQGVLTEMLWESGFSEVIEGLKTLAERGQIEFTGSGKYHPVLPLIPHREIERQIRRNYLTNRYFFGEVYSPKGFFPPEMCYSEDILEPVLESRHEWIILSGVACPANWPIDVIYQASHEGEKIAVFFRDDILSNKISFQSIDGNSFIEHLKQLPPKAGNIYVITAMDAETFGHHIQHWEELFLAEVYEAIESTTATYQAMQRPKVLAEQHKQLFEFSKDGESKRIEVVTISQLRELFPQGPEIKPRPSSWSTSLEDIKAGNYYPLWNDANNPVHQMQWEHIQVCQELVNKAMEVADNPSSRRFADIARGLLDPAFHSCQFWWASKRPWWDIAMVARGQEHQREVVLNAYRAIWTSNCPQMVKREYYYRVLASRELSHRIYDKLIMD